MGSRVPARNVWTLMLSAGIVVQIGIALLHDPSLLQLFPEKPGSSFLLLRHVRKCCELA